MKFSLIRIFKVLLVPFCLILLVLLLFDPVNTLAVNILSSIITAFVAYGLFIWQQHLDQDKKDQEQESLKNNFLVELDYNAKSLLGYCDLFQQFVKNNIEVIKTQVNLSTTPNTKDLENFGMSSLDYTLRNGSIIEAIQESLNIHERLGNQCFLSLSLPYWKMNHVMTITFLKRSKTLNPRFLSSTYELLKLNDLFIYQSQKAIELLKEYHKLKYKKTFNEEDKFIMKYVLHHQLSIFSYIDEYYKHLIEEVIFFINSKELDQERLDSKYIYLTILYRKHKNN